MPFAWSIAVPGVETHHTEAPFIRESRYADEAEQQSAGTPYMCYTAKINDLNHPAAWRTDCHTARHSPDRTMSSTRTVFASRT
jgi:hypothetical protein